MQDPIDRDALASKNKRTGMIVLSVVLAMGILAFASVPLYDLFCRVTGYDGTTQVSDQLPDMVLDREVVIKFNADTHRNLQWDFKPEQREITVKLGQRGVTAYSAENLTAFPLAGSAIYNVTPFKAGKYFHKIQCFCFDEQILAPHERMDMPVLFYVDPQMAEDPNMDDVKVITLSYNFYKTDSKELEDAMEAFYNEGS